MSFENYLYSFLFLSLYCQLFVQSLMALHLNYYNTFLIGISYSLSLFEYPSIKLPCQSCLNNDFIIILSSKYIHSDFLLPHKCENPLICKLSQNIIPSNISELISLTPQYASLPNESSLFVTTKR